MGVQAFNGVQGFKKMCQPHTKPNSLIQFLSHQERLAGWRHLGTMVTQCYSHQALLCQLAEKDVTLGMESQRILASTVRNSVIILSPNTQ